MLSLKSNDDVEQSRRVTELGPGVQPLGPNSTPPSTDAIIQALKNDREKLHRLTAAGLVDWRHRVDNPDWFLLLPILHMLSGSATVFQYRTDGQLRALFAESFFLAGSLNLLTAHRLWIGLVRMLLHQLNRPGAALLILPSILAAVGFSGWLFGEWFMLNRVACVWRLCTRGGWVLHLLDDEVAKKIITPVLHSMPIRTGGATSPFPLFTHRIVLPHG